MLAKLMFISLVLFRFGCFTLSVEADFQAVYILIQTAISCVNRMKHQSVVCPKHAFMSSCWIAVQYVARVLHFSAFIYIQLAQLVTVNLIVGQLYYMAYIGEHLYRVQ